MFISAQQPEDNVVMQSGIENAFNPEPLNNEPGKVVRPEVSLCSIIQYSSDEAFWKAPPPMSVTVSGIEIFLIVVIPLHAYIPIDVTPCGISIESISSKPYSLSGATLELI